MICEKCGTKMNYGIEGATQGWCCSVCGWNLVTTYVEDIYMDLTEYEIYIAGVGEIDKEKIKFVAQISSVNFTRAKQILEEMGSCILKAKAPEVKEVIEKLEELDICYKVFPSFKY